MPRREGDPITIENITTAERTSEAMQGLIELVEKVGKRAVDQAYEALPAALAYDALKETPEKYDYVRSRIERMVRQDHIEVTPVTILEVSEEAGIGYDSAMKVVTQLCEEGLILYVGTGYVNKKIFMAEAAIPSREERRYRHMTWHHRPSELAFILRPVLEEAGQN